MIPERINQIRARVEKLREQLNSPGGSSMRGYDVDCVILFDELSRLQAENDRFRKALEAAEKYINDRNVGKHCEVLGVVREALSAPVAGEGKNSP